MGTIVVGLIVLTIALFVILAIWRVFKVDWNTVWKVILTIIILLVAGGIITGLMNG